MVVLSICLPRVSIIKLFTVRYVSRLVHLRGIYRNHLGLLAIGWHSRIEPSGGALKCATCHYSPPSGFVVFLSEITNRRVKMGLNGSRGFCRWLSRPVLNLRCPHKDEHLNKSRCIHPTRLEGERSSTKPSSSMNGQPDRLGSTRTPLMLDCSSAPASHTSRLVCHIPAPGSLVDASR